MPALLSFKVWLRSRKQTRNNTPKTDLMTITGATTRYLHLAQLCSPLENALAAVVSLAGAVTVNIVLLQYIAGLCRIIFHMKKGWAEARMSVV